MIAILSLILLISAYFLANALTQTNSDLVNAREQRNMKALLQAKAALIAYAASTEGWQTYKSQSTNQPGGLPCPDRDIPPDGTSQGLCASGQLRVGRLPWATIGSDDLRDASGEPLWYAVSSSYYKNIGTNDINSDTQGLLTVTGTAPASNVVAIVFAPGPAIQDSTAPGTVQNRGGANATRIASYLEGFTAGATDYTFSTNALPSDTFNDRLVVITQADLLSAAEPVVAARIERDIKPYLQTYFSQWGAFPFPSKFANPNPGTTGAGSTRVQGSYLGDNTQISGLLPITNTVTYSWDTAQGSVTKTGGTGSLSGVSCAKSGASWRCSFSASGPACGGFFCSTSATLGIQMEGQVKNVGLSFAIATNNFLVPASSVGVTSASVLSLPAATLALGGLVASGNGRVLYNATIQYNYSCFLGTCFPTTVTATIPMDPTDTTKLSISTLTSSADPSAGWFIANEWFRQIYYAASPGYLPGGGGTCNTRPAPPATAVAPSCLRVNNLPSYYSSANVANERAILVLAGRALSSQNRPPSAVTVSDYLEGANQTAALGTTPYVYEHRAGAPTSINDRVVVVAP